MSCSSAVLDDERQLGHFARAKSEGATIVSEPQDGFWGGRIYCALDHVGNQWEISKKHLLLENFLVYWSKEFPIKNIADSRAQCDSMASFL